MKTKKVFKLLVSNNKEELEKDLKALEEIEKKVEDKYIQNK